MSKYTIIKSGAWFNDTGRCRSACRHDRHPGDRFGNLSFRLALDTVPPQRIVKGGSWLGGGRRVRSAYRSYNRQGNRDNRISLRIALTIDPQPTSNRVLRGGL